MLVMGIMPGGVGVNSKPNRVAYLPDINAVEKAHNSHWPHSLVKVTPCAASASMFGVWVVGFSPFMDDHSIPNHRPESARYWVGVPKD